MKEGNSFFFQILPHVVGDDFRIGGYNRTVVMVRSILVLDVFVVDAGIKYLLLTHLHQGLDVSVNDLSRIASRVGADVFHAFFVDLLGRHGAQYHPVPKLSEEGEPEGIILIHIEYSGYCYVPSYGSFLAQGFVAEKPFKLVLIEIGNIIVRIDQPCPLLTSVARDIPGLLAEVGYGKKAVVAASLATAVL